MWDEIAYLYPNFNDCTIEVGMDDLFQPTLNRACDYLSMLGLKYPIIHAFIIISLYLICVCFSPFIIYNWT